jgi:hypothetical protein
VAYVCKRFFQRRSVQIVAVLEIGTLERAFAARSQCQLLELLVLLVPQRACFVVTIPLRLRKSFAIVLVAAGRRRITNWR